MKVQLKLKCRAMKLTKKLSFSCSMINTEKFMMMYVCFHEVIQTFFMSITPSIAISSTLRQEPGPLDVETKLNKIVHFSFPGPVS